MTAPVIGLTTYGRRERIVQSEYYGDWFSAPAQYVDAVRRAGGVPILLPPGETNWQALLALLDAVVIIGGGDIHPDRYGGDSRHPALHNIDLERDASEVALVRLLATEEQLPTLCVCRGLQVANVALGGTLHEHLADAVGRDIHRGPNDGWALQPLTVRPGSLLARVMGATEVTTNSGHHQAVKELGQGLQVVATAEDGIIEALELPGHPWFLAVQWHPEVSAAHDPTQQRIFDDLARAATHLRQARAGDAPASPQPA
jgi:putative glutamine amidotransferase